MIIDTKDRKKITFTFLIIAGLFIFLFIPQEKITCEKECNIILISIDSLGSKYVGTYNKDLKEGATPSIDMFAEKSIVFENYITPAYLTPVTEMSLHTSLSPLNSGIVRFDAVLDNKFLTLAEILQADGYYTAAMGSSPNPTPDIRELCIYAKSSRD